MCNVGKLKNFRQSPAKLQVRGFHVWYDSGIRVDLFPLSNGTMVSRGQRDEISESQSLWIQRTWWVLKYLLQNSILDFGDTVSAIRNDLAPIPDEDKLLTYFVSENYKEQIFETMDIWVQNICEVCGSYQCPYCPFFSSSPIAVVLSTYVLVVSLLASIKRHTFFTCI